MYTGIVEGIAKIISTLHAEGRMMIIIAISWLDDVIIGDSISVNGVCLTVSHIEGEHYHFDVVPETLKRTCLGDLKEHDDVNIERSMTMNRRIGGHLVQGHVDATGEIIEWKSASSETDICYLAKIAIDPALSPYIVNKGYITIDGMSITVIEAEEDHFTVTFIPHTIKTTIAKHYRCGSKVNIETDMMAKYVMKLNQPGEKNNEHRKYQNR